MKVTLKAKTARIGQLQAEVTSFEETTAKLKDTMQKLEGQLQRKQQELEVSPLRSPETSYGQSK